MSIQRSSRSVWQPRHRLAAAGRPPTQTRNVVLITTEWSALAEVFGGADALDDEERGWPTQRAEARVVA